MRMSLMFLKSGEEGEQVAILLLDDKKYFDLR